MRVVVKGRPHSDARTQSGFLLKAAPAIDPDRTSIGGPTLGFPDSNTCPPDSFQNAPELHERFLFARITDQIYTADTVHPRTLGQKTTLPGPEPKKKENKESRHI